MIRQETVVPFNEMHEVLETRLLAETGIELSSLDVPSVKPDVSAFLTVTSMTDYLDAIEGALKKQDSTLSIDSIRTKVSSLVTTRQACGGTPSQVLQGIH